MLRVVMAMIPPEVPAIAVFRREHAGPVVTAARHLGKHAMVGRAGFRSREVMRACNNPSAYSHAEVKQPARMLTALAQGHNNNNSGKGGER
jgi:hypothetical protein